MINVNARSVVNKTVELEAFLLEHSPDIVTITETWLFVMSAAAIPSRRAMLLSERTGAPGGVALQS